MGGDGGVIASNRRYMRGAGMSEEKKTADDPTLDREAAAKQMRFCALSGEKLHYGKQTIVVCPYGRLYHKEAVVEGLIRRKQGGDDELGAHIRGLKDLAEVRFQLTESSEEDKKPVCPITGRELNGQVEAYALIPGKPGQVNVLSRHGMKEMGEKDLELEYGSTENKIRLAPPAAAFKEIQTAVLEKQAAEKSLKKKRSKRKREDKSSKSIKKHAKDATVSAAARARVSEAVKGSAVLSSLFTDGKSKASEKEKKDHLFARS